ncbi:MAG: B12-binding domain-containing radical SAM protein, partial [Candidatus Promineifilaceae bacterium]
MDIFLSHGYFIAEDAHEQKVMKPYPPLGLLYISSHLKAKGFAVRLFDTTFGRLAEFEAALRRERPGLVGLYCNLMTKQAVLRQLQMCRQVGATVVLGGPEPVNYPAEYLAAGADLIVVGEGERTLEELIPHLARHGLAQIEAIPGLIYRDDAGRPARTPAREQIKALSAQPWPDREAIEMERYLSTWKEHHGLSSVSLITARGCPYICHWCSHSVFGHSHRRRTAEDVVAEVAWIKERYDPDQLWYADDVLTIANRWFLRYAALLRERGLRLPFECISRADRLNDEVIAALAEMGCYRLWIGAESGSQRILDGMQRKADVLDIRAKTRALQAAGIQVGMFIMLGYEGEQQADIEATLDHLKTSNPDVFLTTVAYPIKGTKYYAAVEDKVYSRRDWAAGSDRDLGVAGRHSARYYDHATRWLVNEVNLNRVRQAGSRDLLGMARMAVNAGRGRLGMLLSRGEREGPAAANGAGRGWPA